MKNILINSNVFLSVQQKGIAGWGQSPICLLRKAVMMIQALRRSPILQQKMMMFTHQQMEQMGYLCIPMVVTKENKYLLTSSLTPKQLI